MATVRVNCESCKENVELSLNSVGLIAVDSLLDIDNYYRFQCNKDNCGKINLKPAMQQEWDMLSSTGLLPNYLDLSFEREKEGMPPKGTLDPNHLANFLIELNTTTAEQVLAAAQD